MGVRVVSGDLFESGASVLVNPVNSVGNGGAGLHKEFKKRFPESFYKYSGACFEGLVTPGRVYPTFLEGQTIIHFPTKNHWRDPSQYEWIDAGLVSMHRHLDAIGKKTVACPALGCGYGGLSFDKVSAAVHREFKDTDYDIRLYRPG